MALWIVAWALLVAGFDVRLRRIPNVLSLGGAAVALIWLATHQYSLLGGAPLDVLAAFGVAMLLTFPAYLLKLLGAGDVKFLGAFALMSGLPYMLAVVIVAGLVSAAYAIIQRVMIHYNMTRDPNKKRHLPMGLFFAMGILVVIVRQY